MSDQPIIVEHDQRVMHITLNRPEVLNAINDDMLVALDAALDAAARDEMRVLTLTGAGRAFCAGADLGAFGSEPGATLPFLGRLQRFLVRLTTFPLPVIAAVNGTAMGGGLELILAADFGIASRAAKVGDGHANVGVIPGGGGATILHHRVPRSVAKYVVYTGTRLTAEEWARHGLFVEVTEPEDLLSRRDALAADVGQKSPLALRSIKRLIAESDDVLDPARALALELEASRAYAATHDMAEGIAAFNEKRAPRFLGR